MKKIALFILISLTIISCDSTTESTSNNELPELIKSFHFVSLLEKGMPLEVLIPDTTIGQPKIVGQPYGETHVIVGDKFQISIAEGGDLNLRKSDIESDLVYKSTIINEDSISITYKSEIPDSGLEPSYHFYMVRSIEGVQYEIQDIKSDISFSEKWITRMKESAIRIEKTKIKV